MLKSTSYSLSWKFLITIAVMAVFILTTISAAPVAQAQTSSGTATTLEALLAQISALQEQVRRMQEAQNTPSTTVTPAPSAAGLAVGDTVVSTVQGLKVRSTPGVAGIQTGTQALNATGRIVDGPRQLDGYTWWKIDYTTGVDGWSFGGGLSESSGGTRGTSGNSSTPASASTQSSNFDIGDIVNTTEERVNFRTSPCVYDKSLGQLSSQYDLKIVGGPEECDGYTWWKVDYNGREGWVAGGFLKLSSKLATLNVGDVVKISPPSSPIGVGTHDPTYLLNNLPLSHEPGVSGPNSTSIKYDSVRGGPGWGTAEVIDGPEKAKGFVWWKIEVISGKSKGTTGWVPASWLAKDGKDIKSEDASATARFKVGDKVTNHKWIEIYTYRFNPGAVFTVIGGIGRYQSPFIDPQAGIAWKVRFVDDKGKTMEGWIDDDYIMKQGDAAPVAPKKQSRQVQQTLTDSKYEVVDADMVRITMEVSVKALVDDLLVEIERDSNQGIKCVMFDRQGPTIGTETATFNPSDLSCNVSSTAAIVTDPDPGFVEGEYFMIKAGKTEKFTHTLLIQRSMSYTGDYSARLGGLYYYYDRRPPADWVGVRQYDPGTQVGLEAITYDPKSVATKRTSNLSAEYTKKDIVVKFLKDKYVPTILDGEQDHASFPLSFEVTAIGGNIRFRADSCSPALANAGMGRSSIKEEDGIISQVGVGCTVDSNASKVTDAEGKKWYVIKPGETKEITFRQSVWLGGNTTSRTVAYPGDYYWELLGSIKYEQQTRPGTMPDYYGPKWITVPAGEWKTKSIYLVPDPTLAENVAPGVLGETTSALPKEQLASILSSIEAILNSMKK